jgi:tetratricopeptide (TPR) repeat protein
MALRPSPTDTEIAKWQHAVEARPADSDAQVNLGDALMQKARETADAAYYNLAEAAYNQALRLTPGKPEALTGLAWVAGGRHEFEQSIAWSRKSIAADPRNAAAYGLIGDADVEMGRYDAAYSDYQKMLDIRPDISSYSRGAHLLYLTGNVRKALWLMNKAMVSGAPYAENTGWCRAQIAQILFSQGALLPAEQVVADGLSKTPNNYHLLVMAGRVRAARRDYVGSIAAFEKAVAIAPQIDALAMLGDIYHITGDNAHAEREYSLAEVVYKTNKANGILGDALFAKFLADHDRRIPEALRLAQAEYLTRPNVVVADTLAWCLYKSGQYAEARNYSRKALAQNTQEASYLFHAGMIAMHIGERPTAQRMLYQAMSLNPQFSPVDAPVAALTFSQLGARPVADAR